MKLSAPLAAACAFVAALGVCRAQPPADETRWDAAVKTFVSVLSGEADRDALVKILSDHSWVAPFARNRTESVAVLPNLLGDMRVVSAHACLQPSVTSASDLVADIQADPTIDASIRERLVPADGKDLRAADATMARWFGLALDAQPGDPVALIALYDEGHPASASAPATPPSLTLLLVRGEIEADGSAKISRVLYGTLDAAVK